MVKVALLALRRNFFGCVEGIERHCIRLSSGNATLDGRLALLPLSPGDFM